MLPLYEEYDVILVATDKADIDNLYKFFQTLAGVDTCKLTVPHAVDGEETVTVVIEGYGRNLQHDDYYSMNCVAKEVFEPWANP